MNVRIFGLCISILIWAISVCAQRKIDEHGVQYPTEEELAANKRMTEVLRHPTLITLRLVSIAHEISKEQPTDTPAPHKQRDWIDFQLMIGHSFSEPLVIWQMLDPYYDLRPELFKDGDLLPYSKQAQENADRKEKAAAEGSGAPSRLLPGREYEWQRVNLEDWYEPLGPGHYQLTVRRRFVWDGEWIQSNPVTFDVEPGKPPKPIPDGVSVELVPDAFQDKPKQKLYRLNGEVYITVVVINNSNREVPAPAIDIYYGNRPQLFKDGVLLAYLDEIVKLLSFKEENARSVDVSLDLSLLPHTRTGLQGLDLTKWYGQLDPGHYRLINRHRFEIDGPWTADSAELLFEILR
ncbi:MAG TPA: hypothetical protein VGJ48_07560 [Pyrinomonadaceae bacterium]|jgi:hypothetical protein